MNEGLPLRWIVHFRGAFRAELFVNDKSVNTGATPILLSLAVITVVNGTLSQRFGAAMGLMRGARLRCAANVIV